MFSKARIILILFGFSAASSFAQTDPQTPATETPSNRLTLIEAARTFFQAEPSVASARLEVAVNDVAVLAARDRFATSLAMQPGARGQRLAGGGDFRGGFNALANGKFLMQDRLGGVLTATADAQVVSDPSYFVPGQGFSVGVQYAIPLLRNRLGALWELEAVAAEGQVASSKATAEAIHLQRCGAFLHLFVTAQSLQEQRDILSELLKLRERTYSRTVTDYNKKLLTKLDFLASKSDFLAARQRLEALVGLQKGSLAALQVAMGVATPSTDLLLVDDVAIRKPGQVESGFLHPELRAFEAAANVATQKARVVERKYSTEISVIPGVGTSAYSNYFFINGITPTTDYRATLGVGLEFPFVVPERKYEPMALRRQAEQWTAKTEERRRQLGAALNRALANVEATKEQISLVEERLELAQAQFSEAKNTYLSGRLPFQDYVQHFVVFEEARLQRAVLGLELSRAEIESMIASGVEPLVCRQSTERTR